VKAPKKSPDTKESAPAAPQPKVKVAAAVAVGAGPALRPAAPPAAQPPRTPQTAAPCPAARAHKADKGNLRVVREQVSDSTGLKPIERKSPGLEPVVRKRAPQRSAAKAEAPAKRFPMVVAVLIAVIGALGAVLYFSGTLDAFFSQ